MPFFPESSLVSKRPQTGIPLCGSCGLYKKCKSPKMEIDGFGKRKILIVGEVPGKTEDENGVPFVGEAGKYLNGLLKQLGVEMRRDCWITNSLICHTPNNAKPTEEQIDYCHPHITKAIKDLKPEIIITVGHAAVVSLIKEEWTESVGIMSRWVGAKIPSMKYNAWICPIYHPSFVLREVENAKNGTPIVGKYKKHLQAILKLNSRPYLEIPNPKKDIEIIVGRDEEVKELLMMFYENGGRLAFDYETNMLKPGPGGKIVSVGICWEGYRTIAFPWTPGVRKSFQMLMESKQTEKYAHNLKYEDQWSRVNGINVVNWKWDSMTTVHVQDSRREFCSLAFQAYTRLGVGSYDAHISPYLKSGKHSYKKNKIREIALEELLMYNGLDAWCCYQLTQLQMRELNVV